VSVVTTGKSRDYSTSSFAVFLIWWYLVRKHYFRVFSGNLCCNYFKHIFWLSYLLI